MKMFKNQLFKEKKEKKSTFKVLYAFGITSFLIFISVIGYYSFIFRNFTIDANVEDFAQFGDFLGGVLNPIFAFLAFIALLYTIKLQSTALQMSKDELEATRNELKESRIAQQEQSKSLELQNNATKLQSFENTFFQLNSLWLSTRNSLKISISNESRSSGYEDGSGGEGRVFQGFVGEDIKDNKNIEVFSHSVIHIYLNILKNPNRYNLDYEEFNLNYEIFTAAYFGQLYQLLKFVNDKKIDDKQRYIDIIRAQFTKVELEFLFYHCLGTIGKRRFKKLIEEYEFFEHISLNDNIDERLTNYDINVFGKNEKIIKKYKELKNI